MRRVIILAALTLAGGAAGGGYWTVSQLNGPAVGSIKESGPGKLRAAEAPERQEIDGPSFRYLLGAGYRPDGRAAAPEEERSVHVASSFPVRVLAVSVRPSSGLADESEYRIRKLKAGEYRETRQVIKGQEVVRMRKNSDGFEEVIFWPHRGRLAVIAFTANGGLQEDLEREIGEILESWEWKR